MVMKGYRITENQKNELLEKVMLNGSRYNPVKDINGDYFIFEKEYENCGFGIKTEFIPELIEEEEI